MTPIPLRVSSGHVLLASETRRALRHPIRRPVFLVFQRRPQPEKRDEAEAIKLAVAAKGIERRLAVSSRFQ